MDNIPGVILVILLGYFLYNGDPDFYDRVQAYLVANTVVCEETDDE
jgi:hypothetical protein